MAHPASSSGRLAQVVDLRRKAVLLWTKEIWRSAYLNDPSPRGWLYAILRVISITATVFQECKVPARSSALSFSSLLGLGPLVAISVLIGGFVLGNNSDPDLVANKLGLILENVAPQLRQLNEAPPALEVPASQAATPGVATHSQVPPGAVVSPELVNLINDMISNARSGSAGVFGIFSLIIVVLLLFKSVEDAFNDIWGVRQGRSVVLRIIYYWTILTLGAVLFFAALALLTASTLINLFNTSIEKLPQGHALLAFLHWALPLFSVTLLLGMLTLVYRIIPNTRVYWRAAFAGAAVVVGLLLLNNYVALLYVRRVMLTKSLYGSLALPIVLMLGLYVFWLYILIGGVISYAVQNVHFRNSQAAWGRLTEAMRERLSLVVLLTVGRRFQGCLPPVTTSQLSTMLKVPTQILNECLNRLVDMKLVITLQPAAGEASTETRYQPARPLNRINLFEFKTLDDNLGDDPIGQALERIDPILHHYDVALDHLAEQAFFQKNLEQLFAEHPFDESTPPFAFGEKKTVKAAKPA